MFYKSSVTPNNHLSDIIRSYWIGPAAVFFNFKWNPYLYRSNKKLITWLCWRRVHIPLPLLGILVLGFFRNLFYSWASSWQIHCICLDKKGRQTKIVKFNVPSSGDLMPLGVLVTQRKIIYRTSLKTWKSN